MNRHNSLFGFKVKDWNDLHEISYIISNVGGMCGFGALDNFNLEDIKPFILNNLTDKDAFPITKETANKLLRIVEDYFSKHLNNPDWIPIEYNRIVNRLGKEKADDWLKWQKR